MVKKYGELYAETRKAFMTQEDSEIARFWARNLLCHVTVKASFWAFKGSELLSEEGAKVSGNGERQLAKGYAHKV